MIYPAVERITRAKRPVAASDEGITLLETVIAMFVLMIFAVGVLPILTHSLTQSATNSEVVTATSLANQAIEDERVQTTCAALTTLNQSVTVRPNLILRTVRTISTCPTTFPATVRVKVTVTNATTGALDISLATLVFVTGA
jgi:type II secretory pathway pseudopilin PulG